MLGLIYRRKMVMTWNVLCLLSSHSSPLAPPHASFSPFFFKQTEQLYAIVWVTEYGNCAPGQSMLEKPHCVCVCVMCVGGDQAKIGARMPMLQIASPPPFLWVAWGFDAIYFDQLSQHQVFSGKLIIHSQQSPMLFFINTLYLDITVENST